MLADLGTNGLFLIFFQFLGLSSGLKSTAILVSQQKTLQTAVYLAGFFGFFYLVSLPIHFYSGFIVEKQFNLSNQTTLAWAWDEVKKIALSLVFFIFTMELFYGILAAFPKTWWVVASIGWLLLGVALTRILPTFIIPLFYKTKPLEDGVLKTRLAALCLRCGVCLRDIRELSLSQKTRKGNAALVGLGKTRRILLGDTMLQEYTAEEIEMVIAHEIGHHVKQHIPKNFLFNFLLSFSGFALLYILSGTIVGALNAQGLTDLAIFPSLVLLSMIAGLFILPLQNGFSRWHENEADRFALKTIPSETIFVSLMTKLGRQNLSDPAPHPLVEFFLYDHPSINRRIKQAPLFLQRTQS